MVGCVLSQLKPSELYILSGGKECNVPRALSYTYHFVKFSTKTECASKTQMLACHRQPCMVHIQYPRNYLIVGNEGTRKPGKLNVTR